MKEGVISARKAGLLWGRSMKKSTLQVRLNRRVTFDRRIKVPYSSFFFKEKLGEGTSTRRSKVTLLFSLTCSIDFFMLSPHNEAAFLALIPPSFTSLNPFVIFFRPLQPHSSSHKYESMRIPGSTQTLSVIYRKCCHAKQAVRTKSSRL